MVRFEKNAIKTPSFANWLKTSRKLTFLIHGLGIFRLNNRIVSMSASSSSSHLISLLFQVAFLNNFEVNQLECPTTDQLRMMTSKK